MLTIIGTGKKEISMKTIMQACALLAIMASGCKTAPKELDETEIKHPRSTVTVTHVGYGSIDDELTLSATTIYLKRNVVTASIPAFITNVRVKLGDLVNKGDVLYELESKERRSLGNNMAVVDTSLAGFGLVKIRASATGVISTLDKQQPGDYVLEGTQLCTIAESTDLAFQVNVPYEFTAYTNPGGSCTITLPDQSTHKAFFTRSLTSMNVLAQTQTYLAKTNESLFLPENMIVKASVHKNSAGKKQLLPKSCVLSDEMMKEFWIMKFINDSTAVKVPVTLGNTSTETVEILSPVFDSGELIIEKGNYGLSDTALVVIGN